VDQALRTGRRLTDEDRQHLHFALGKAHEDACSPEPAYRHYAAGNAIRAKQLHYDPGPVEALVAAAIERLDVSFFAARQWQGDPGADPIFVVRMPRSGSTLGVQILACHSTVERTHELTDVEMAAGSHCLNAARTVDH